MLYIRLDVHKESIAVVRQAPDGGK
jgi:hypothetical protein